MASEQIFSSGDLFDIFYEEAKRIARNDAEAKNLAKRALTAFFDHYDTGEPPPSQVA